MLRVEICVISSLSDYCHIITPPKRWGVTLIKRIYLGHYHEFHYTSCKPLPSSGTPSSDDDDEASDDDSPRQ